MIKLICPMCFSDNLKDISKEEDCEIVNENLKYESFLCQDCGETHKINEVFWKEIKECSRILNKNEIIKRLNNIIDDHKAYQESGMTSMGEDSQICAEISGIREAIKICEDVL